MKRIAKGILVLMLNLPVVAAEVNSQDKPATPAEQYKTLRKEYDRVSSSGVPLTDAERLTFVGRVYKGPKDRDQRGQDQRGHPRFLI